MKKRERVVPDYKVRAAHRKADRALSAAFEKLVKATFCSGIGVAVVEPREVFKDGATPPEFTRH